MKIESEGMSRIALIVEVDTIMNIPEKQFKKWSKTSAPGPVTREGLLIDTLIAKGWRLIDFSETESEENK